MLSLTSELSQEIDKLKLVSSCAKCNNIQDLRRLANCGHIICIACINSAASRCPVCRVSQRRRDSLHDAHLQDVLANIHSLHNINKPENNIKLNFESDHPQVIPFFAPASAINKRDHKGETRLHKDCRDGNLPKVEALLLTGVDANVQDFAGWTALHEAVTANKVDVVKLLLEYGAFPSVPGLNYTTPLHAAVQENNIPIAKLLVEYGADLMCYNKDGKMPIDFCSNSNEMRATLCLTPRHYHIYKVYTIPQPKVFPIDINKEDMRKLSQLASVTIITECAFLNTGNAKYAILGNNKPNVKHLQAAMLQGSCIVTTKWIDELGTKKTAINPMDYLPDMSGYALSKAVMNMFNMLPKLFDGLHFYFCHSNVQKIGGYKYTVGDLKMLVQLGGGKVLNRRPSNVEEQDVYYPYHATKDAKLANTTHYLIYDETQRMATDSHSRELKYKSAKWLITCINNFCIKV